MSSYLMKRILPRQALGWTLILLLIFIPLSSGDLYYMSVARTIAVNATLGIAVVILLGYAGEFSFAYGAIFGAAGYVSWELQHILPEQLALLGGVCGGVLVGTLLAAPALRIRGLQLALVTLATGLAASQVFARISGFDGIVPLPPLKLGFTVLTPEDSLLVVGALLAIAYLFGSVVLLGRRGRRLLLMQTDSATARSLGIFVTRERIVAFAASALVASLIGSIYPQIISQLAPASYEFSVVVNLLLIAVIGGLLWVEGAIAGAILFGLLTQAVQGAPSGSQTIIFGVLLLAVIVAVPSGVVGISAQAIEGGVRMLHRVGPGGRRGELRSAVAPLRNRAQGHTARDPAIPVKGRSEATDGPSSNALAVTKVGKHFGGLQALDDVHLHVDPGELLGLVGANGAGKSTLLNVISGLTAPDVGEVWINGEPVTRQSPERRSRSGLGRAFQTPQLVGTLSVADNVRCSWEVSNGRWRAPWASLVAVELVLERLGLADVANLPATELPYGLVKLVDIARALIREPNVLLIDEPAAGLGESEIPRLSSVLDGLREEGIAMVVVEHNVEWLATLANRLTVLDFGKVIAEGTPHDVLRDKLVIEAYIGRQTSNDSANA